MNEFDSSLLAFFSALLITAILVPSWINVCHKWHLFEANDERKNHSGNTPTLGGLAIYAGLMISFLLLGHKLGAHTVKSLMAASLILFFTGFFDDLLSMAAGKKLLLQLIASGIIAYGGTRITGMQGLLGIEAIPEWMHYPATMFIIVIITNAFNLIDGIDGLAASLGIIASALFGFIFFNHGRYDFAILSFCLTGSLTGFLIYNFHPARIFMGDTGSLIVGFILASLSIELLALPTDANAIVVHPSLLLAILFIPLYDVLRVMMIRIVTGNSPFQPDRNHIHHMILSVGFSQRMVTLVILAINGIFITLYFIFPKMDINLFTLMCVCLGMLIINLRSIKVLAVLFQRIGGRLYKSDENVAPDYLRKVA
jgi:UDP-GlcNAc:undecaprenyl-phosphate/decaprenyl-phosphate GlcNAc-1-phosphate transferase